MPSEAEVFVDDVIAHFGIPGMKWGRRKDKGNSAVIDRSTKNDSEDFSRTTEIATKVKETGGTHSLSNKELRDLVDRINLEQNFARLNTPAASKQSPIKTGIQYVSKKIVKTGDMAVDAILKTAVQMKVQEEVKKKLASK